MDTFAEGLSRKRSLKAISVLSNINGISTDSAISKRILKRRSLPTRNARSSLSNVQRRRSSSFEFQDFVAPPRGSIKVSKPVKHSIHSTVLHGAVKFKQLHSRRISQNSIWSGYSRESATSLGLNVEKELRALKKLNELSDVDFERLFESVSSGKLDSDVYAALNKERKLRPDMTRAETRHAIRGQLLSMVALTRGQEKLKNGWRFHAVDTEREGGSMRVESIMAIGTDIIELQKQIKDTANKLNSPTRVRTIVPDGLSSSQSFIAKVNNRQIRVRVPSGAESGDELHLKIPSEGLCTVGSIKCTVQCIIGVKKRTGMFHKKEEAQCFVQLLGDIGPIMKTRKCPLNCGTSVWDDTVSLKLRSNPDHNLKIFKKVISITVNRCATGLFGTCHKIGSGRILLHNGNGAAVSSGLSRSSLNKGVLLNGRNHSVWCPIYNDQNVNVGRVKLLIRTVYNILDMSMPCTIVQSIPKNVSSVPGIDCFGFPLTSQLGLVFVGAQFPKPQSHSFVCTDQDRRYHYGHCVTFWRPARMKLLRVLQPMLPITQLRTSGMCILEETCIMAYSHQPIHDTKLKLYKFIESSNLIGPVVLRPKPIVPPPRRSITEEGIICDESFGRDSPVVPGGIHDIKIVDANILQDLYNQMNIPVKVRRLIKVEAGAVVKGIHLPPCTANISMVIGQLGLEPHVIVWLWACILAQRSIVIRSSSYEHITDVTEAVMSLMWPFEWNGVYIPVLPLTEDFMGILHSPVPMLIGIVAQEDDDLELEDYIVVVDLDNNTVEPLPEPPWRLPADILRRLLLAVYDFSEAVSEVKDKEEQIKKENNLRLAFAKELSLLLRDFPMFLDTETNGGNFSLNSHRNIVTVGSGYYFDSDLFVKNSIQKFSFNENSVVFLKEFLASQLFAGFLADYVSCKIALAEKVRRRRSDSLLDRVGRNYRDDIDARMRHLEIFESMYEGNAVYLRGKSLFLNN